MILEAERLFYEVDKLKVTKDAIITFFLCGLMIMLILVRFL